MVEFSPKQSYGHIHADSPIGSFSVQVADTQTSAQRKNKQTNKQPNIASEINASTCVDGEGDFGVSI